MSTPHSTHRASAPRSAVRWFVAVVAAIAVVLAPSIAPASARGTAGRPGSSTVDGLRVLLTNDDGVQPGSSIGLYELRHSLCESGADVIVVAPWTNMSGASASITYGSSSTRFTLTEPSIDDPYQDDCLDAASGGLVYGSCVTPSGGPGECDASTPSLTPADAATLGSTSAVQELAGWTDGPQLVISGINRGGNDGLNVNISGTLGAATIASSLGYPAIAVSASSSGDAAANASAAASWTAGFVALLNGRDLLPEGYVVAANYPRTDRDPVTEATWTDVAQRSPFATGFIRDGLSFESTYAYCTPGPTCGDPEPGSDSAVYSAGAVAVTPISVDRTFGAFDLGPRLDAFRVRLLVTLGLTDPA